MLIRLVQILLFPLVPTLFLFSSPSYGSTASIQQEYIAVPGLMDLRSTFSDGSHTIEELVRLARSRGFKVLFINDHDRIAVAYGVLPFRNIFRFKKEFPSIMTNGPEKFLDEIKRVAEMYPDMVIIPGCETSAYYYWSGSLFNKSLTLHQYDKKLLIMNLEKPDDYRHIPNLHNSFTFRYTKQLLPHALIYMIPLVIGIYLFKRKERGRFIGSLFIIVSILGMMDMNPFRSSLFTPYQGDQGIQPYHEVIHYVQDKGGLCFWNYPEQRSGIREAKYSLPGCLPDITFQAHTPPYPQVLHESKGYTGFSALYGDHITAIDPGREWDQTLNEYCRGERETPPWGISTADFHQDGRLGLKLGAFATTFLVKEFSSKQGILEALKQGRFYCSRGDGYIWPELEYFYITNQAGQKAVMGEHIITTRPPVITFQITYDNKNPKQKHIFLIRAGNLIQTYKGEFPLEVKYIDTTVPPGQKTYYRIMDNKENLASNPIFVEYRPDKE
ncbi:MAG: hypothetical protein JW932_02055 [Deltaproteobacteria bacterium]|nr:hypothetical protein [Deltaproteobacteria bacterium]